MKYSLAFAALAGLAAASPLIEKRQDIDFAAYNAVPVVPDVAAPLGDADPQAVTYVPTSAATAAIAAATGTDATGSGAAVVARDLEQRQTTCTGGTSRAAGVGSAADGQTDTVFLSNPAFSNAATGAATPVGWTSLLANSNKAASDSSYLTYTRLSSYSVPSCAATCQGIAGCNSFNIYFERDATIDPFSGTGCENPPSLTYVKCAMFGKPMNLANMQNVDQYQNKFHVVIAGSNTYNLATPATPTNFNKISYATVLPNAPGYMGVQTFPQTQPYDPSVCASACDAKSKFDVAQGLPSKATPDVCGEFMAYILYKNGNNGVFTCTYYNNITAPPGSPIAQKYFNNVGQYDQQGAHYTIGNAYGFPRQCNWPAVC